MKTYSFKTFYEKEETLLVCEIADKFYYILEGEKEILITLDPKITEKDIHLDDIEDLDKSIVSAYPVYSTISLIDAVEVYLNNEFRTTYKSILESYYKRDYIQMYKQFTETSCDSFLDTLQITRALHDRDKVKMMHELLKQRD